MKLSPAVLDLHSKDLIIELAEREEDLEIMLEITFGSRAFDTNFKDIPLREMQELVQEMINDNDLVL